MDIEKFLNFTSFTVKLIDMNEKHPNNLFPFITLSSLLSITFLCFVVQVLIGNIVKHLSNQHSKGPVEKSKIKTVSILSVTKHLIQCRLDLQHTARSLVNTYGLAWKVTLFGLKEYVCLQDPAMLQKLYMSWEPGHLHKPNRFYSRVLVGPLQAGLTSSRANIWKRHRTAVCKGFSYNSLKNQVKLFNEYGKKLVYRLNDEQFYSKLNPSSNFNTPSFSRIIHETAFNIICHISSGKEGILTADEINMFHNTFYRCKKLISYRIYHPWLVPNILWSLHPKGRELNKAMKITKDLVHKICRVAKEECSKNKEKNQDNENFTGVGNSVLSLVDEMIKGGLSDGEIYPELFTFLASGHETVSMTLNMTLFHLAANAEYQRNCQEEVDQLFFEMMGINQQEISMEAISNLKYLDRCIKEELRLYPTTPSIGRQIDSPITFDENTKLKAGTTTLTSLWLLHRNKDYFPDPEKFDPDRFLSENCTKRGLCEYMPFGTGPRNCIGGKSGTLEVKLLVAYILHNFELSTDITVEMARDAFEKCIWPPPELHVQLKRRR